MFKKTFLISSLALALFSPLAALAVDDTSIGSGIEELRGNLGKFGGDTGLSNAQGEADLKETVANIINIILGLLGIIAVIMLLLGGWKWMTAGGNEQSVTEAKDRIKNAIIGLAVVFMAWIIVGFTVEQLKTATGGGSGAVPTVDGTVKPQ